MNQHRTVIRGAARGLTAAATLLSLAAAFGQQPASSPSSGRPEDESVKLQSFEVLGSRIKRVDAETPAPVLRITAADLQATGFTNVDDALRALPFNNGSSIVPEGSGNGFASGTSTINLRGLGVNNTLVLLNGRRTVPSGAGSFNGFLSVIDLRQIPTTAIESIEVLKDGASAVYGSDAVAGVINITLRRSYTGVGMELSYGNTLDTDSAERSAFFIAGATAGKTSVLMTVDWYHRNMIKDADLDFARTADLRANRGATGNAEFNDAGNLVGIDSRSSSSFPARFFIPGTNTVMSFVNPTSDPNPANAVAPSRVSGAGFYDFQQITAQRPEETARGFSAYVRHEFSDTLYGFIDVMFRRVNSINIAAGSPFSAGSDRGSGTNGRLVVPAENPFNPYGNRYFGAAGRAIELSTYRLVNAGPRVVDSETDYPRIVAGLGGELPRGWSWEAAYMFAQGSFLNLSPGTSFDSRVQEALLGVNIDGVRLYANPFGPEDPRITDYYSGTNPTKTTFKSNLYDASISGDLFQLPAGAVGVAFGAEYRTEALTDTRTLENESGNVVGGSEGNSYGGQRKVTSFYAEAKVPLTKQIELQVAGRYEDYTDFGETTKPKVAVGWKAFPWLMLRGSFSQSFKAPDLGQLYLTRSVSFTSGSVPDPRRPDQPNAQIRTVGRGNPALLPEETDTTYFGLVFEIPRGWFKNLAFDVGYFKFDQKNLITRDGANFTLTNELNLPAGRVVRNPLTAEEIAAGITVGTLSYVATDWYNANKVEQEGWDFGLTYRWRSATLGTFNFGAQATYIANYEQTSANLFGVLGVIDIDGNDPVPQWRGNTSVSWRKGDWSASLFMTYVHGFNSIQPFGVPEERIASYVRFNPQVSYRGFWNSTITVGMRNALNATPPRYIDGSTGYHPNVHSGEPAFAYIRLSKEF
jgi:iron complex outermembrane receptor protein